MKSKQDAYVDNQNNRILNISESQGVHNRKISMYQAPLAGAAASASSSSGVNFNFPTVYPLNKAMALF